MTPNTITEGWAPIPGWPDYAIRKDGLVLRRSTNELVAHSRTASSTETVRLSRGNRYDGTYYRKAYRVYKLVEQAFAEPVKKKEYEGPTCEDKALPGERWMRVKGEPAYMISDKGRMWSWKTCSFIGAGPERKVVVYGRHVIVERLKAEHFGYDAPTLPGEEWRQSFIDAYLVSNLGRVFGKGHRKIIRGGDKHGYVTVNDENGRRRYVHQLVAQAFIPREEGREYVDHINEDKKDNRVVNLRWCTLRENVGYYLTNHPPRPIPPSHPSGLTS